MYKNIILCTKILYSVGLYIKIILNLNSLILFVCNMCVIYSIFSSRTMQNYRKRKGQLCPSVFPGHVKSFITTRWSTRVRIRSIASYALDPNTCHHLNESNATRSKLLPIYTTIHEMSNLTASRHKNVANPPCHAKSIHNGKAIILAIWPSILPSHFTNHPTSVILFQLSTQ